MPILTHPSDLPCRVTDNQCVVRDSLCYHCSCTYKSKPANIMAADDCRVGSYRCPLFYKSPGVLVFSIYRTAWICDVCEYHRWPQEYIIFTLDTGIDGDV